MGTFPPQGSLCLSGVSSWFPKRRGAWSLGDECLAPVLLLRILILWRFDTTTSAADAHQKGCVRSIKTFLVIAICHMFILDHNIAVSVHVLLLLGHKYSCSYSKSIPVGNRVLSIVFACLPPLLPRWRTALSWAHLHRRWRRRNVAWSPGCGYCSWPLGGWHPSLTGRSWKSHGGEGCRRRRSGA